MRRVLILSALVAGLGFSLGCKSTNGRCDCNYDPANAQLTAPSNPYPTVGTSIGGTAKPDAKMETPAPMPKPKN